ncbi:MAG: flagellar hook capping FlgD N-terminal domain-containing protein [Pseudomonadota bacterium]
MTDVSAIGAVSTATQPTAQLDNQTLDYDAFLRLLVEQMKNQDPLEPVSDTEYIAQLATFSNVEQNIIANDRLLALLQSNTLSDAQSLIGRDIETPDGTTGEVESVQIASGQTYATLTDGTIIVVGDGLIVR